MLDLRHRDGDGYVLTANVFSCEEFAIDNAMVIDLVACKHQMRWLKLCEDNLAANARDWKKDFEEHIRRFQVVGWGDKAELTPPLLKGQITVLNQCRFRKGIHGKKPVAPDFCYGEG